LSPDCALLIPCVIFISRICICPAEYM
jgi:hypothetical protein